VSIVKVFVKNKTPTLRRVSLRDFEKPGRSTVHAMNGMVATSHPLAASAASDVLRRGGNALDAAICASAVLCVVEPQSTGIGGDCFILMAKNGKDKVIGYNGSGRSPAAATLEYFQGIGLTDFSRDSVHSVTLPGAVDAWLTMHADHGQMGMAEILAPAIDYARHGYPIHERVHFDWLLEKEVLAKDENTASVYLPDGKVPEIGDVHYQPQLATTLEAIAHNGRQGFYEGPVAEAMIAALHNKGGVHSLEDMNNVRGNYVSPITSTYRGYTIHQIPPNNQGVVALMMLNILEGYDLGQYGPLSPERTHLEIEAGRIAFKARDEEVTDLLQMKASLEKMLSKSWAAEMRNKIKLDHAMTDLPDLNLRKSDTVYISVVDKDRNAVSFINSTYYSFGSGIICPQSGVVFQNRGMSFRLESEHPNCIAPNKRPLHTIMPGMLTKDGKSIMPYGVMGGDYQPYGHTRFLTNVIDYGLDPQSALDMPRVFGTGDLVEIESALPREAISGLLDRGHTVQLTQEPLGGGQAIWIDHERGILSGGSDPRKDGCALGY
jgi:gamma-glutamyltranspeptidase / glutathione hydrolase